MANHKLSVSREQDLLLSVLSLDKSRNQYVSDFLGGLLDWSSLIQLVKQNGIFPLFYQRIENFAGEKIPLDQAEYLDKTMQAYSQNNLRIIWKLIQCINLFTENDIEYIVIKGPVLSFLAYGDLSLRYFSDIDILIREMDFSRTYDLLSRSGYIPKNYLSHKERKFQVKTDNHFSFTQQGDILEVHWGIAPKAYISHMNAGLVWQERQYVCILEKEIYTLSAGNTILFTCLHGAKHNWNQLKWVTDLAYILQRCPEETYFFLLDYAAKYGFYRQVCLGLLLSEKLIGTVLPSKVHQLVNKQRTVQRLADEVILFLLDNCHEPSKSWNYKFFFHTREHWRDRFYYIFNLIFFPKPPDWHLVLLPEELYFLYFFLRPFRLLFITVSAAFSYMFGIIRIRRN